MSISILYYDICLFHPSFFTLPPLEGYQRIKVKIKRAHTYKGWVDKFGKSPSSAGKSCKFVKSPLRHCKSPIEMREKPHFREFVIMCRGNYFMSKSRFLQQCIVLL